MAVAARFDDLTAGSALAFGPPHRVLTTDRVTEVAEVLAEVWSATAAGAWAYGYVAYEAAPGLATHQPAPGDPPLIWFGLTGAPLPAPPLPATTTRQERWVTRWTDKEHAYAVDRVRDHIAAGDTYQCNLTDRLTADFHDNPISLYADLVTAQHGAYNAYLDLGRHVIASASPELFFDLTGDVLRTRPMKGTAPRATDPAEDRAQARKLRDSPKEQAENLMIVDLLRNDLGRVAGLGSVRVTDLFTLEPYPTVWQMTSQITARLRDGLGLPEIFGALFPCGSVTGAPKPRSMEIIRDLESGPRGVYCGAVGLVAPPSAPFRARFNVAIRTAVIDRSEQRATYGAGGGITWDSVAAAERAELLTKAAILGTVDS